MEDDQTVSVSKGVFIFKNNFKPSSKSSKVKKRNYKHRSSQNLLFSSNKWYQHYFGLWKSVEEQISELNNTVFLSVLDNLVNFIKKSHDVNVEEIPTAVLFTGINMPDHEAQFTSLSKQLKRTTTPHVAHLQGEDCQNVKYFMENMIHQFVNNEEDNNYEDEEERCNIKKSQLNLSFLQCWYDQVSKESNAKKPLVAIISDFESFNLQVLQKFILIISCYIKSMPFVLVFGIATDINTLHKSLPFKVFSKIRVKVFHSQKSTEYLNNILEMVFFPLPFQLGGNVFNLFTELFLFYDLSVSNFIQNIKYVLADHFSCGNIMTLCHLEPEVVSEYIQQFSSEEFKALRQLPSFKKLLESKTEEKQIKLLVDDKYFSKILFREICKIQDYINKLHLFLKCLLVLVEDLPGTPLGKQLRELYAVATSKKITQTTDYKECMKLINFQSKDELSAKLSKIVNIIEDINLGNNIHIILATLKNYANNLNHIDEFESEEDNSMEYTTPLELKSENRLLFKQRLLENTKCPNKSLNKYEKLRTEIINTLSNMFETFLKEPETNHFHEIFFYNNMSVKDYIIGSHRSAIHNALNDPHFYLRCACCDTSDSCSIKPTMPDICIAYKLHLEYGKMINLYDWLQSFVSIVDPDVNMSTGSKMLVKPEMQARFTQAVSELEFLGFIKSSKRKTDHVQKLTWGG